MSKFVIPVLLVMSVIMTAVAPAMAQDCSYTIETGDTLSQLAVNWNTSVEAIQAINGMTDTRIVTGQTVTKPGCVEAPPQETALTAGLANLDQATILDVQRLASDPDAPATVIQYLDRRWQLTASQGGFPGIIGSWDPADARSGVQIAGPAFIWTDFFRQNNVPAGVTPVSTAGFWGVWEVPASVVAEIPESSNGGRWVSMEIPATIQGIGGGGTGCSPVDAVLDALTDLSPQDSVQYMDTNPTESTHYYNNEALNVAEGSAVLIWRDWGAFTSVPEGMVPATMSSTSGGYGVWFVWGPAQIVLPNGGATIYTCDTNLGG